MYEHKTQPLAPRKIYYARITRNLLIVLGIFAIMLLIGTIGYYFGTTTNLLDSFHNAAMILSGMGPVIEREYFTPAGKLFSSFYALFSGVIFISSIGFVLAPGIHRIFHTLHMEQ